MEYDAMWFEKNLLTFIFTSIILTMEAAGSCETLVLK
jgi:hypothetical protein